jgi:MFS family permease
MRDLLCDREFLVYFAVRQSGGTAFAIESVALGWQIYALRHNALDVGLVGLTLFLPMLFLAIPAGMLADRIDRRVICIACVLGDAAGISGFVALTLIGVKSLALNLAAVLLIGITHSIGDPAGRTLLASIVRSEHFARAQAATMLLSQVIKIAGPAFGGVLLAIGPPVAFAVTAALYALCVIALSFLTPRPVEKKASELGAAVDGIRYILRHPNILAAISLDLFAVLFGGAIALLPIYATSILHVGPIGFGALRAAPAIGAALGAAYLAHRPITRNDGQVLLCCTAGFGAATIVFGLSRNIVLSLIALVATGTFDIVSVVIRSMLVQLDTPNAMRGRVSAIESIFIGASNELGAFESGALAAFIGAIGSVVVGGVGTLIVVGIWAILFPALRSYDRIGGKSNIRERVES